MPSNLLHAFNDVDIDRKNQKQDDDLFLGISVRVHLRKFEDQLLGTADLANFYLNVRAFLSKCSEAIAIS